MLEGIEPALKLPLKADRVGGFTNTAIYAVKDRPGLYRRVSREGRKYTWAPDGRLVGLIETGTRQGEPIGGLCELVRWEEMEILLRALINDAPDAPTIEWTDLNNALKVLCPDEDDEAQDKDKGDDKPAEEKQPGVISPNPDQDGMPF